MTSCRKRQFFFAREAHGLRLHPGSRLCDVLDVSRSGFHTWLNRPNRTREIRDAKLVMAIETNFKTSDQFYGTRRIWRDVQEKGLARGLHRIAWLTRINALRARQRSRGKPKGVGQRSIIADNTSTATFGPADPTRTGWPISPRSGQRKAGSRSRPYLICISCVSSGGP